MTSNYYQRRRCRATGTHIIVCPTHMEMEPDNGGAWICICDEHGTCVQHETLALARSWAAYPDWCEECSEILRGLT